jgi:hypothetical protein
MGTRKRKDLTRARSADMAALKKAEEHLADRDPGVSLRAAAVIAQLATSAVKLVEVVELSERLEILEARVEGRALPLAIEGGSHVKAEA